MQIIIKKCLIWIVVVAVYGNSKPVTLAADMAWPNWMGPKYDGISEEKVSADWPEGGLPVAWERELGIGFSSVAIAEGWLFTLGHVEGEEIVYCLDAKSGDIQWTHKYPSALVDNLHEGGPGSTPTIDGELVYTLGREGQLFCFRAEDGKIVWSKMLQEDLGVELAEWGFTASPYILGEQLILEAGRVVSYDKTSGKKLWQTAKHDIGYGSAISFTNAGRLLLATLDNEGLRVVQAKDGNEVSFVEWDSPYLTNSTTPIVRDDTIFISTGYNIGCGLFRLQGQELEPIYTNREMRNHFNNSILLDGYLYGMDGNSHNSRVVSLKCVNYETGETIWEERGFGCGSLMVADRKLLVLSDDGTLVLAKASPEEYEELARSEFLDGRCWTVPVLLNGRIYGRNASGRLVCVELPREE